MSSNSTPLSQFQTDSHEALEREIVRERLRQARQSFNLALAMTTVCTAVGLTGIGLLFAGKISEGAIATTGGMSPILPCVRFARDANNRLDNLIKELKED